MGLIGNLVNKAADKVVGGVTDAVSGAVSGMFGMGAGVTGPYVPNKKALVFPLSLETDGPGQIIHFTCLKRVGQGVDPHTISLPIPAGVAFGDGANYGTIDLGIVSAIGAQLSVGSPGLSDLKSDIDKQGAIDALKSNFGLSEGQAMTIMSDVGINPFAEQMKLGRRAIANPNTNTNFTGNTIRSFSFAFKMMADSPGETAAMQEIQNTFRKFTYANSQAGDNRFTLDYPPTWTIQFLNNGAESQYFPKIFSCYLQSVNTTFNGEGQNYMNDGSPMSIDVSLTFQETRVLTREDIEAMTPTRGIGPDGNPEVKVFGNEEIKAIIPEKKDEKDTGN